MPQMDIVVEEKKNNFVATAKVGETRLGKAKSSSPGMALVMLGMQIEAADKGVDESAEQKEHRTHQAQLAQLAFEKVHDTCTFIEAEFAEKMAELVAKWTPQDE